MTSLRHRLLWVMLFLTTLSPSLSANVDDPIGRGQFSMVGSGPLSWWGMTVYDAALYAPQGTYQPEKPHYIEITYRFSFSREQLASSSLEEIERLFGKRSDRDAVLAQFRSIFPDVTEGDRIVVLHHPGKGVEFFRGETALGLIENATLAANFFSIWLDPETSKPDLRVRLLGHPHSVNRP